MIRRLVLPAMTALAVAACASEPAAPPPAPEPTYLDYATFKQMVNAAYKEDTYEKREAAFTALLARDDLRQDDRAETYLMRGIIRGIYVNDGPYASPYCSVEDYAKFDELASPDHPRRPQMLEDRTYQLSRYQYFSKPASCGE